MPSLDILHKKPTFCSFSPSFSTPSPPDKPSPIFSGSSLDFNPPKPPNPNPQKRIFGKRKRITRFSTRSARTLAKLFARLDYRSAIFITLTTSKGLTPQQAKKALLLNCGNICSFRHQFLQSYPLGSFVWRMEKQANSSPHFHLILWTGEPLQSSLPEITLKVPQFWLKACRSYNVSVSPLAQDITAIKNSSGAFLYLCGHGTKKNQTWPDEQVGRYWGATPRKNLPFHPVYEIDLKPYHLNFLQQVWEQQEESRIRWHKNRYPCHTPTPRPWDTWGLRLFTQPVARLLKIADYLEKRKKRKKKLLTKTPKRTKSKKS